MKYCKRFTEGLGYFACFLILIFLIYQYFSFGDPIIDEETGVTQTVFNSIKGFSEYLIMLGIFLVSAVICSSTDKLPFIGIIVSAVPVYYVFRIFYDKLLVFCPMIIAILSLLYFTGEIVATVQWVRQKNRV